MRIIKLEAENVKRLKAVSVAPERDVVTVGGLNAQGKSSLLDSISMAIGGQRLICADPIRHGSKSGSVSIDLGELTIVRKFTKSGSTLVVKNKEGAEQKAPQAILDKLVGTLTFDPLAFTRMEPKKQVETLRAIVGIDFTDHDKKRANVFANRTEAGRDLKSAEARLSGVVLHPNMPVEELSINDLMARLQDAMSIQEKRSTIESGYNMHVQQIKTRRDSIAGMEKKIADMMNEIVFMKDEIVRLEARNEALATEIQSLPDIDTAEIKLALASSEDTNRKVRENKAAQTVKARYEEASKRYDEMTKELEGMDAKKEATLAEAKFPVAGLSFDEDGVKYQDVPLDQISQAEKIRVSLAIGTALNPQLKVMLIRDGSLLDDTNMGLIHKFAEDNDLQIWIEVVSTDKAECSVIIHDGEIAADESEVPE